MKSTSRNIVVLFLIVLAGITISCRRKYTCAAYHSSFIIDPTDQDKYFSLFDMEEDTVPKGYSPNKDANGLSKGPTIKTYNKKHYVIPMVLVPPKKEESKDSLETSATDIDQMEAPEPSK